MSKHYEKPTRRQFLLQSICGMGFLAFDVFPYPNFVQANSKNAHTGETNPIRIPKLKSPNQHGIRLPTGFNSRIVAISGRPVDLELSKQPYLWHEYPDGGATFPTDDGGWIYVSNSETSADAGGGASALRFSKQGALINAYRILDNTTRNCAGGPTPWNSWLSCEEIEYGRVWECDIYGKAKAVAHDALGWFQHEAVAYDTLNHHLYLTEDEGDGCLYRFVPGHVTKNGFADLSSGELQVAIVDPANNYVQWTKVTNPNPDPASNSPTRKQVVHSTKFKGGEGIWYYREFIYFTTKWDNRVWALNTKNQILSLVYDYQTSDHPILAGVDNITVAQNEQLLVAEDGGDMQVVILDRYGHIAPFLQIIRQDHSEIAGIAFSPSGDRLYFSSQRGDFLENNQRGITYEITGPFNEFFSDI